VVGELKHQAGHSTQLHDLEWLEGLLVLGLISLHDKRFGPASQTTPSPTSMPSPFRPPINPIIRILSLLPNSAVWSRPVSSSDS